MPDSLLISAHKPVNSLPDRRELSAINGWQYLLPGGNLSRLLCYDTTEGALTVMLSRICPDLTVIHSNRDALDRIANKIGKLGLIHVHFQHIPDITDFRVFANGSFNGFVLHDIRTSLLGGECHERRCREAEFRFFLTEIFRVLNEDGFCYIALRNRMGYDTLEKRVTRDKSSGVMAVSVKRMAGALKRCRFGRIHCYPYLLNDECMQEIIPLGKGYTSVKNSLTLKERLKEVILGKWGVNLFAPGYGILAHKGEASKTLMDMFVGSLIKNGVFVNAEAGVEIKRHQVLFANKSILSLGSSESEYGEVIAVLTDDDKSIQRRQLEARTLQKLRETLPSMSDKFPRTLAEGKFLHYHYFVMSELPGITIDTRVRQLDDISCNAIRLLIDFHKATAARQRITPDVYGQLFGQIIERAMTANPVFADRIGGIGKSIRDRVMGRQVTSVWFHGDYKIENIVIDKRSLKVNGVIDWELSLYPGPPLLDVWYLLAYNRMTTEDKDFLTVFRTKFLTGQYNRTEAALYESYLDNIPVPGAMVPVLLAMFFIHHIGCRFEYDLTNDYNLKNIRSALDQLTARLAVEKSA